MSQELARGVVEHLNSSRKADYLYRVSIKGLIRNDAGDVLVVKEDGRTWWDLPGGGMDHGESLQSAIAREMKEEVNLQGDFEYTVLTVDEPAYLSNYDFWQLRLIFELQPSNMSFSVGEDGDELAFVSPELLKHSDSKVEQQIYRYCTLASRLLPKN